MNASESGGDIDSREEKKLEYAIGGCDSDTQLKDLLSSSSAKISDNEHFQMETAWTETDRVDHFRMEIAWAQAEADHAKENSRSAQDPLENGETHHVSSLMARSDSVERTCGVSNTFASKTNGEKIQQSNGPLMSLVHQPAIKSSMIQRYRTFLQKHEPSLDILERIMERFVFYRYLFNHDHSGIKIELYYAALSIIRWVNDVVLVGWGDGMGMTIGNRREWLGDEGAIDSDMNGAKYFQKWVLSRMHVVVPVLRAILTATTCVYPALEAWARRQTNCRSFLGTELPCNESQQQQEEWKYATTADLAPQTRRLQWERRQSRAADLSYWVERIRFVSRLALMSISWWARHNREQNKKENMIAVPPLIRRGAELDPSEELLPLAAADTAAAVTQYKGKRTGRRSVSNASTKIPRYPTSTRENGSSFVKYLRDVISSKHNILYFHIVGELLHILRPLYWSHSESIDWRRRAAVNQGARRTTLFSNSLWKAWLLSLVMDVISDELLDITTGCGTHPSSNGKSSRHSLLSRSTGRTAPTSPMSSVVQSEQEELTWRRGRRSLYLLRSPVYSAITLPLMTAVTRVISKIPSFGLGRWASQYILEMMGYWNEHRFMLE